MAATHVYPHGDMREQCRQLGIALNENVYVSEMQTIVAHGDLPRVRLELILTGTVITDASAENPSTREHRLDEQTRREIDLTD